MSGNLDTQARSILKENDLGGYTIPTKGLYPYQWNWDSAFVARGFQTFDPDRAWTEIETLFEGQWDDGMVPHIVFRKDDPSYFPGPAVWGTNRALPTSGHSQPPVVATIVRDIYEADREAGEIRARALFPKILAWHRWFHRYRDPQGLGIIAVIHPWESGRDNTPDWDGPLQAVDTSNVKPYVRKDTSHVDPSMRPLKADYDRYLAIVDFGRSCGWDAERVALDCPFFVADPGMTFILLRADRDLLALAKELGEKQAADEIEEWIERAETGAIRHLWSDKAEGFVSRDLRKDRLMDGISSASFLSVYAGISDERTNAAFARQFDRIGGKVRYLMPSWDPEDNRFEHLRYWRGPVWAVVNSMIGRGLLEAGDIARAERIRADTASLIETSGFAEYYSPVTGAGAGGGTFSWTAAVWLFFARHEIPQD